jgi:dTDP-4-amino-4,6-dideoxygalactose transaminase
MSQPLKIPFFDYRRLFTDHHDELLKIIDEVSSRGAFIMQKELKEFELELAQFTSSNFTVGVGNATDGLELAWLAFGLKPGDEVIISAHTMVATASAIVTAGGRPIPVEIGEDNLIDANAIEGAISSRTVGISPTHLNGRTCNMERILQIANENNLVVIEDSAQALGSKYDGKHARITFINIVL